MRELPSDVSVVKNSVIALCRGVRRCGRCGKDSCKVERCEKMRKNYKGACNVREFTILVQCSVQQKLSMGRWIT